MRSPKNPQLVPDVVFFDMPNHVTILKDMLKAFNLGEHLLMIGNQGITENSTLEHYQVLERTS